MIDNQAQLFFIFIINGTIIGILFDFFRILRKSFKTKDYVTYIEDFLFWVLTGIIILYSIFIFNNGEIRLYMFIAIAIGIVLYMILLSTHVIKFNLFLVNFFKKFTRKLFNIIIIPFNYIYMIIRKVFFKPISFIFINVRKISTNLYKKPIKISNKIENKGGF